MKWISAPKAATNAILGSLSVALIFVATPASAQVDSRLDRIERQLSALQRAVFPGGDDRFFEPEITPEANTQGQVTTQPQATTSALTDVLVRLDAIEQQLARLTAATEVNENALVALETRIAAIEGGTLAAAPATGTSSAPAAERPSGVIPVPEETAEVDLPEPPAQTAPSPERVAAVQAIAKPATGDQGDDEYTYGFRLWDAGFYPEAQQQLALFVAQYPDHWRTTYGRNLLGRAFLDAGDPRAAATHFFENYQSDSAAARAPDSLLYLAESMIALEDTRRACIALAEFGDTYPALAVGRLSGMYEGLSGRVDCD
ncbi:tetratricopeptide repeat protein [Aurantiacibacter sp. MUD61]|uniref:tetratricopeptide repeat protein n=1 Tax=Aurantiacibacter sp. MUD61 TaxID=3009083 RepID=UPI0022F0A652|nr:tetratricopeptide repeat protein [Aurantiacibacter sp. MUD61]